ncbi:MAG TPA: hypothetical protein DDW49_00475 [Deltaproteobacteria bacterium]|nr:hypothetical protein [Deltaproteobacteria bacterium]
MPLDTVFESNRLRWDGQKKPFYEVYYAKLVDEKAAWSFWCRYTLLHSVIEGKIPTASVWAIFKPWGERATSLKENFSVHQIDFVHAERFIQIGPSYLSLSHAVGLVKNSHQEITWNLQFEDPTLCQPLFPYQFMYRSRFPQTKYVAARLSTSVSGSVSINHQSHPADQCKAHQAHLWGTGYALSWAWAHCNQFVEDASVVFEGLSAEIKLGPYETPFIPLFSFIFEGKRYRGPGVCRLFKTKNHHDFLEWHFEVVCNDTKFAGRISRPIEEIVGVEYEGPLGEARFCHNTMMGNMELDVYKRHKKEWVYFKKLTAQKTVAFETVAPTPDPRVHFVL